MSSIELHYKPVPLAEYLLLLKQTAAAMRECAISLGAESIMEHAVAIDQCAAKMENELRRMREDLDNQLAIFREEMHALVGLAHEASRHSRETYHVSEEVFNRAHKVWEAIKAPAIFNIE